MDRPTDDDDDPRDEMVPETPEFVNPVASGSQFLFGSALGDSVGGGAQATSASLLPVGQDEAGQPTGETEPLTFMGQEALDSEQSLFGIGDDLGI